MPSSTNPRFLLATERDALESFLDAQREGLIRKVVGVDDEAARKAPTASDLSLLGLVKHCATWEARWFQVVVAGREAADGWPSPETENDDDLYVDATDSVEQWVATYREQIAASKSITASLSLDAPCARGDIIEANVRYVLFHLIEETARHAGHADIIRESLDGSRGMR